MFCVNCGNQLPDGALFCHKCGAKINSAETVSIHQPEPQYYTQPRQSEPIKGIVFNIISFLITVGGIIISLFAPYFSVRIKHIEGFFNSGKSSASVSLFDANDFAETVRKYLDSSTSDSALIVQYIFWICVIDIFISAILLIIRFTKLSGNLYNARSSYVPVTPALITVICLIIINNTEYLQASMSTSIYILIALFIANLVIKKFGCNFNRYENFRARRLLQGNTTDSIKGECVYCSWKNSEDSTQCSNCGKPLGIPIEYLLKK